MTKEEKSSLGSASEEIKCGICGKILKDKRAIGSHMRVHRKKQDSPAQFPLPGSIAPIMTQPQQITQPPAQPLPMSAITIPQQTSQPQFDAAPLIAMLTSLLSEKKDPIREKLDKAFMDWLDTVFSLPAVFTKGYGKGLEDAIKSYAREAVKEELRELREIIDKVVKRGEEEKRGREEAHS